jgi:homospermidine synthase
MAETESPIHAEITGPIVMIGFGSIGRGTLPLIERHFSFDKKRIRRYSTSMASGLSRNMSPRTTTRNC